MSANDIISFSIQFMKNDTCVSVPDIAYLESRINTLTTKKSMESWMKLVKEFMGKKKYTSMKELFVGSFRQDVGFIKWDNVGEESVNYTPELLNMVKY